MDDPSLPVLRGAMTSLANDDVCGRKTRVVVPVEGQRQMQMWLVSSRRMEREWVAMMVGRKRWVWNDR